MSPSFNSSSQYLAVPHWYDSLSPLGSAVRYIASLSPLFHWVGIYKLIGNNLILGPFMGEKTEHKKIPIGKGICGTAVQKNTDLNIPDVSKIENYLSCSLETRSELVVLIRNKKNKILGQIDIDSHVLNAFTEENEKKIKKIADELGELWKEERK